MKKYIYLLLFVLLLNSVFAYTLIDNRSPNFGTKHQYTVYFPNVNYQPNEPLNGMFSVTTNNQLDYETNTESDLFYSLNENELIFGEIIDYYYEPVFDQQYFNEDLKIKADVGWSYWLSNPFTFGNPYEEDALISFLELKNAYDPYSYKIPYPWQIESILVDCGDGEKSYNVQPFTPSGDQSKYAGLDEPPYIIETPFSCTYSERNKSKTQKIIVTYRKNRFYVLNEYFIADEYKDNEFTSYMANPYQLGLPNANKCYKGSSYFNKVNGVDINSINADIPENFALNDEFCQRE